MKILETNTVKILHALSEIAGQMNIISWIQQMLGYYCNSCNNNNVVLSKHGKPSQGGRRLQ